MVRFIHGADFHLDSPFSGLTPEQAAQRRGEQRELLDRLAQLARERQADLVLLSGDLLDSEETVYRETAQALSQSLGAIPCPVFLAPGNHDCYSPSSVYATLDWPDNVHIFPSGAMERVDLPELNCTVYGRAFLEPRQDRSPLAGFHAEEDGTFRLGCLHGDTAPNSPYGPITQEEIAASGLDYLALGHIHQYSGLQRAGETFWAYPGCPEGRGFDELGEKGVLYLEAEPGQVTAQFVPLCRRRYQILTVDLTGRPTPWPPSWPPCPGTRGRTFTASSSPGRGRPPTCPPWSRPWPPASTAYRSRTAPACPGTCGGGGRRTPSPACSWGRCGSCAKRTRRTR